MQYGPRADGPLSLWDITLLEGKDSIGPALQHWNDMRPKTFTLIFRQLERDCRDVLLHVYLSAAEGEQPPAEMLPYISDLHALSSYYGGNSILILNLCHLQLWLK